MAERNAYYRTTARTVDLKEKIDRKKYPKDWLANIVTGILSEYYKDDVVLENNMMINNIDDMKDYKAGCINPAAYVLSYFIVVKDKDSENYHINEDTLKKIFKTHKALVEKHHVSKIDLIRYSRYWINIYTNPY